MHQSAAYAEPWLAAQQHSQVCCEPASGDSEGQSGSFTPTDCKGNIQTYRASANKRQPCLL